MKLFSLFLSAVALISATFAAPTSTTTNIKWAGFRYSTNGAKKSFGNVPSSNDWRGYIHKMKSDLGEDIKGTLLITVGQADSNGKITFEFPQPSTVDSLPNVQYSSEDKFESIITRCDKVHYKVWLVVEPGNNDLVDLANIVLEKYGDHKSVAGIGAELEYWYKSSSSKGKALTDKEAKRVVTEIRKRDRKLTFLVKHWSTSQLPEYYTTGMVFVNTSQAFKSLAAMKKEFSTWADTYPESPVMFEIGYASDKSLWESDPIAFAKAIADDASQYNEQIGIIWTDYTMNEALKKM